MLKGLAALEATDWSRLHHAYGRATDTPAHLQALWADDADAHRETLSHLWSAILHQGTPWTATGPVASVVCGPLDDALDCGGESTAKGLTSFLVGVAEVAADSGWSPEELEGQAAYDIQALIEADDEALYDNEDAANALYARSILGCMGVIPILTEVMVASLLSTYPRVRAHASMGAVILAGSESMRVLAPDLAARLVALANSAEDIDERCAHVLALGDLGFAPADFLEDPSPAVRLCAALAPELTSPAATTELLTAIERHARRLESWFVNTPPQFRLHPRFAVVARLIERLEDFDRLADAAVAIARATSKYCVDEEWGPLLAAAFPDGSGIVASPAQRRFLGALVKNKKLWDPKFGNASKWFRKAGLPYDRRACARMVA